MQMQEIPPVKTSLIATMNSTGSWTQQHIPSSPGTGSTDCTCSTPALPTEGLEHPYTFLPTTRNPVILRKSGHGNPTSWRRFATQTLQHSSLHLGAGMASTTIALEAMDTQRGEAWSNLFPGDNVNAQAALFKAWVKKLSVNWKGHIKDSNHLTLG